MFFKRGSTMWIRAFSLLGWLFKNRDVVRRVGDLLEQIQATEDLKTKVLLALDIAAIGADQTATDKDDLIVEALRTVANAEWSDQLYDYVERYLNANLPVDDEADRMFMLAVQMAAEEDPKVFASKSSPSNPALIVGIASLVISIIRMVQERRRSR